MAKKKTMMGMGVLASVLTALPMIPQASAASSSPITIRMMIGDFGNVADKQLLNYLVKPYEKAHPGVKIQVEFISGAQTNVDTKAILGVNSGNPPNIVAVFNDIGVLAQKGAIIPLTDLYEKYHIKSKDFIPANWSQTLVNGVPYAFPSTSNPALGMWYNPDAMKAAGLNPKNPPKTWNQLYQDSLKVVKFSKNGNLERIGWQFGDGGVFGSSSAEAMAYGHDYTWQKQGTKWIPTPLDPHNIQILTQMKKLSDAYGGYKKYSKFIASDQSWQGTVDYLAEGKSLFRVDGFWNYLGFDQYSPKFHYMAAYEPTPHGRLSEQADNSAISWAVAFPKGQDDAHLTAAWDFTMWAFDLHSAQLELTTNGSTALKAQAAWDKVAANSLPKDHAYFKNSFRYFTDPVKYITDVPPNVPIASFYQSQLTSAVDAVLLGQKTPQQALQDVANAVKTQMMISGGN